MGLWRLGRDGCWCANSAPPTNGCADAWLELMPRVRRAEPALTHPADGAHALRYVVSLDAIATAARRWLPIDRSAVDKPAKGLQLSSLPRSQSYNEATCSCDSPVSKLGIVSLFLLDHLVACMHVCNP